MLHHRFRFLLGTYTRAERAAGAAACVDLFHSTDFEPLCSRDGAACRGDGSGRQIRRTRAGTRRAHRPLRLDADPARARAEKSMRLSRCLPRHHRKRPRSVSAWSARSRLTIATSIRRSARTVRPKRCGSAWQRSTTAVRPPRCVFGTGPALPWWHHGPVSFTGCNIDGGAIVVECGDPM